MTTRVQDQYRQKLVSAEQAAGLVHSGDLIFMGEFVQTVEAFDAALALRKNELKDVNLSPRPVSSP